MCKNNLFVPFYQDRFQVKSPPSTYLTKIKSFYQDQGGVTRRVSTTQVHPPTRPHTFQHHFPFLDRNFLTLMASVSSVKKTDPRGHPGSQRPGNISSHQSHWVIISQGWPYLQFRRLFPLYLGLMGFPPLFSTKLQMGPRVSQ